MSGHPEVPRLGRAGGAEPRAGGGVPCRRWRVLSPGSAARLLPFTRRWGGSCADPGAGPRGSDPPRAAEMRRAALPPGTGGAHVQAPGSDPGVHAAVARVARGSGSKAPPGDESAPEFLESSPLPLSLRPSSLPPRWGRSRVPGPLPTQPETLRSSGHPCCGNSAPSFSRPRQAAPGKGLGRAEVGPKRVVPALRLERAGSR